MKMYCSECAKSLEEDDGIHMFTEYMRSQFVCNECYEVHNKKENAEGECRMKARKKPVVVEVVEFTGFNWKECMQFMGKENLIFTDDFSRKDRLNIETLEGIMTASVGDYIIKGIHGEFYPCKPDIFHSTYEIVEEKQL